MTMYVSKFHTQRKEKDLTHLKNELSPPQVTKFNEAWAAL